MSYNRKVRDQAKQQNFVAKHDFNRGGFHGKSHKAKRSHLNDALNKIDLNNLDKAYELSELWEE